MSALIDEYRRTGAVPSLARKVQATDCLDELRGMYAEVRGRGEMTDELDAAFKARAEQIKGQ